MKVLVVSQRSICPDLTDEEIRERWQRLKAIPGVSYQFVDLPRPLTSQGLDEALGDADGLIGVYLQKGLFTGELFKHHPRLRYVATTSHGYEGFERETATAAGVVFTNTIYGDKTIAQYALALLLELCHHVSAQNDYVRNTYFTVKNQPFTKVVTPQIELSDKTVGVVGLGAIGRSFAAMVKPLAGKVIAYDPQVHIPDLSVRWEDLLRESDVISLHCPLLPDTRHLICAETLAKMKDGVMLINTARGGLIAEEDLLEALNSGKVSAAGLDVLENERPVVMNPLIAHPRCVVTGHIAWLTRTARLKTVDVAVENLKNYVEGHPTSVINPEVLTKSI